MIADELKHRAVTRAANAVAFEIDDADRHGAGRIEGQLLEPEGPVEGAKGIVQRMGQDTETADISREAHGRGEGEAHQGPGIAAALIASVDGELAEQQRGNGIGPVAVDGAGAGYRRVSRGQEYLSPPPQLSSSL